MPELKEPQPSLKPTAPSTLFVAALAASALMLLVATKFYEDMPRMSWFTPVALLVLGILLGYTAFNAKARIDRKPGAKPVEPLLFARYAALAKASAIGGALCAGAYAALVVYTVAQRRAEAAADDLPRTAFGFVACLVLVAAALWLERSCRIPPPPEDDED